MTYFFRHKSDWDNAYTTGKWGYLSKDTSELSRQALVASLTSIHKKASTRAILELGCGEGMLCQFINERDSYLGIDISDKALNVARKHFPNRRFRQGDIGLSSFMNSLLTTNERYDCIILNEILYYLNDDEMKILCHFLVNATGEWNDPIIVVSICRSDAQNLHHGSYYWSTLFDLLNHCTSLEIADQKHRWDIKTFQGLRPSHESD